ncbi:MAG: DUF2958 domain-containing protein, partial [Nitrososphaeria archaeon]|nr:DUF2958 domain-containing protein [Nitrososphaeria archaeon]
EFFGWVTLGLGPQCDQWGWFSLEELESVKLMHGLGIERDLYWTPRPFSEAVKEVRA